MKQRLHVELEDGRDWEVDQDGRDIRAWESMRGESSIGRRLTYSMVSELGYLASVRTGCFDGSWEDFDKLAITVEGAKDAAEPESVIGSPTQPARTDDSSASQPPEPVSHPANSNASIPTS